MKCCLTLSVTVKDSNFSLQNDFQGYLEKNSLFLEGELVHFTVSEIYCEYVEW